MEKDKEPRVNIEDLPKDMEVSEEDSKKVAGGLTTGTFKLPAPGEPKPKLPIVYS